MQSARVTKRLVRLVSSHIIHCGLREMRSQTLVNSVVESVPRSEFSGNLDVRGKRVCIYIYIHAWTILNKIASDICRTIGVPD